MEPNENNLKPQPTGGLKLMTVFIAVLALHVVVIGGFTVWHLLYPSGTDADLTVDKTHKNKIVADSSIGDMPGDTTATDKAVTPATTSGTTADNSAATTTADGASTTASPAPDANSTASDTSASPSTASTESSTPSTPATPTVATPAASTPPVMAEDASAAAANPPAVTTAPGVAAAPTATHPVVATPATTPDLAPPADASMTASADSTTATPAVAAGASYTVKKGDSLARIARRHHITLAALRSANSLKSDRLHIAQVLVLPGHGSKAAPADADAEALATPAPAATASGPVADTASTETDPATATPASPTVASTMTPHHAHKIAGSTHHLYTVVRGDTLTKIAKRYHTSTSAIVAANGLTNAGRLSIGQKLHIPSHEARTADDKPIEAEPHGSNRAQLANNLP